MKFDAKRMEAAIEASVRAETDLPYEVAADVAFHMTDWLSDLRDYHDFCLEPEKYSSEQVQRLLIDFLVHVPNHVAAAAKLLTGIPVTDILEVGATTETDESDR